MIVMVIITILMLTGIDKSPICLLCCFASYSATLMEEWNNFGPTPLPLTVFQFWKQGPTLQNPNKGSTQL